MTLMNASNFQAELLEPYARHLLLVEPILFEHPEYQPLLNEAVSLRKRAKEYWLEGRQNASLECWKKVLTLYEEVDDDGSMAYTLHHIAHCYSFKGEYHEAEKNLNEALKHAKRESNNCMQKVGILNSIAINETKLHKLRQALRHAKQAMSLALEVVDSNHYYISRLSHTLGCIYYLEQDLDLAYDYFRKELDVLEKNHIPRNHPEFIHAVSNIQEKHLIAHRLISYWDDRKSI